MAIEKLQSYGNDYGVIYASQSQMHNKINEIIDHINSQNNIVEKHEKVEQEPNKVELVPLDDMINEILDSVYGEVYDYTAFRANIKVVLSKYGVPAQKKFTGGVVGERLVKSGRISHENDEKERYGVDMLYAFLTEKGLLEE